MMIRFTKRKQRPTSGRGTHVHYTAMMGNVQVGQVWQERLYMQKSTDCGWCFQVDAKPFDLAETLCGERTTLAEIRQVFQGFCQALTSC